MEVVDIFLEARSLIDTYDKYINCIKDMCFETKTAMPIIDESTWKEALAVLDETIQAESNIVHINKNMIVYH